jgi:hypothetical protein
MMTCRRGRENLQRPTALMGTLQQQTHGGTADAARIVAAASAPSGTDPEPCTATCMRAKGYPALPNALVPSSTNIVDPKSIVLESLQFRRGGRYSNLNTMGAAVGLLRPVIDEYDLTTQSIGIS